MKRTLMNWMATASFALISSAATAAPPSVEMTWMSIANWYFKIGDKRIVMDGYISRLQRACSRLLRPTQTICMRTRRGQRA